MKGGETNCSGKVVAWILSLIHTIAQCDTDRICLGNSQMLHSGVTLFGRWCKFSDNYSDNTDNFNVIFEYLKYFVFQPIVNWEVVRIIVTKLTVSVYEKQWTFFSGYYSWCSRKKVCNSYIWRRTKNYMRLEGNWGRLIRSLSSQSGTPEPSGVLILALSSESGVCRCTKQ